jgi:N-acetyl-gamma-glutamyl-phosphate reductase
MTQSVGIVGFRGYSGIELVRILERHPHVEPVLLEHRSDSEKTPAPRGAQKIRSLALNAENVERAGLAAVFLATPPEVSMEITPALLAIGTKIIDLSGAFRLRTVENYKRWYKADHSQAELLACAAYGLPEFGTEHIRKATLISNPGCYPTAANLAIRPLLEAGLVDRNAGIVCDAKSGVSGAGRKASLKTSFCEVTENFSAYSVLEHRHVPEVLQNSGLEEGEFSFSAQLIPVDRGILETIYFRFRNKTSANEVVDTYERFYSGKPFVRLYDPGTFPDLHSVQRTNFCDIGVKVDEATRRCVVVSAIDNLGKGAAGQAIQNMNLALGFAETDGLL